MARFSVAQLDQLPGVACPCGIARRAFGDSKEAPASVHLVEIKADAAIHHHQKTHEMYVVLEGEGVVELDGEEIPVRPLTAIWIRPGCRHRARGSLRLLNIPIPPFDPSDEFVEEGS